MITNDNNDYICKILIHFYITTFSLSAINKVLSPEQHVKAYITAGSSESYVSVLELNSYVFIMKANPHVCSERQRREERDIVNDVEDDK